MIFFVLGMLPFSGLVILPIHLPAATKPSPCSGTLSSGEDLPCRFTTGLAFAPTDFTIFIKLASAWRTAIPSSLIPGIATFP
jgi:hypothetical protein